MLNEIQRELSAHTASLVIQELEERGLVPSRAGFYSSEMDADEVCKVLGGIKRQTLNKQLCDGRIKLDVIGRRNPGGNVYSGASVAKAVADKNQRLPLE